MQPSIIPRGSIYSIASGPSISRGLHRRKNSGAIELLPVMPGVSKPCWRPIPKQRRTA